MQRLPGKKNPLRGPRRHMNFFNINFLAPAQRTPFYVQQFTYGVVSEGVVAESLRKFCGNLQEIRFIASGKGAEILRKVCGNFVEIAENFLQWPLPERPHKWTADMLGPQKKSVCASFPGKGRKEGIHINFCRRIFGGQNLKGVPNGPFSATKSSVYCFFLPLNILWRFAFEAWSSPQVRPLKCTINLGT